MVTRTRVILFLLLACTAYLCFSQHQTDRGDAAYQLADRLYTQAGNLPPSPSNDSLQDELNHRALDMFRDIIAKNNVSDSVLLHCYIKAGVICHYFDSLPQAQSLYLKALSLRPKLTGLADSFFFQPTLFAGSVYYSRNLFDSALFYYKQAEHISDEYAGPPEGTGRLYNLMGAMFYEDGNYRRAENYFQKALSLLSPQDPSYDGLSTNFKLNIAVILVKLEEYDKAAAIFKSLVPFKLLLNEIYHNLGIISLNTGDDAGAIEYFRKTKYENSPSAIELYYTMAQAFSNLHQKDSTTFYINRALEQDTKIYGGRKNNSAGLLYKFMGDEKLKENDPAGALVLYQKALTESYPAYDNADPRAEPKQFSGAMNFTRVFGILTAKADAFGQLYLSGKARADLEAAYTAYRAAFDLADHVATTYDSDEARLFLNKIKYAVHVKAIQTAISLYEITADRSYLEQAFNFDQKNKAAALTIGQQENTVMREAGIPPALAAEQEQLRSTITRLTLKADRITNAAESDSLDKEISDNEISLARIREKITNVPGYNNRRSALQIPPTKDLQDMLDDRTALLSYHLSQNELLVFCIRQGSFNYIKQSIDSSFFSTVRTFIMSLHDRDPSQRYAGTKPAADLYKILIAPLRSQIKDCSRLIIIPDDELNYIPFEALQDENNKYLVQSYSVQYQFSAGLLQRQRKGIAANSGVLAFAPFSGDVQGTGYASLPYSGEEVLGLQGKILLGAAATKQQFINHANNYHIVQLATHAAANDSLPARSYISFYPGSIDTDHILFAQEIYGLRLDSTDLIILSACETGSGRLVHGEGLMSITRAFSYAGCPNLITSLWKATDRTTAFITIRLHFYLDKGYTKDHALQSAKIDLLKSNDIPAQLKTPDHWSHLVFIGDYEPGPRATPWYWLLLLLFLPVIYLIKKIRSRGAGS